MKFTDQNKNDEYKVIDEVDTHPKWAYEVMIYEGKSNKKKAEMVTAKIDKTSPYRLDFVASCNKPINVIKDDLES